MYYPIPVENIPLYSEFNREKLTRKFPNMNIRIDPVLISFIFLILITVSVHGGKPRACCEKYCYEFDNVRPQEEFFSSKTSYFIGKHEDLGKDFHVPGKIN